MAILLSASPAPVDVAVRQLLPLNDASFAATVGGWVASAGTRTRDTTVRIAAMNASLLFSPVAPNDYVDLPIAGTFKKGVAYSVIVAARVVTPGAIMGLLFGKIGTDSMYYDPSGGGNGAHIPLTAEFTAWAVVWTPTADRTGVSIRYTALSLSDVNIGFARLYQLPEPPVVHIEQYSFEPFVSNDVVYVGPTDRRFALGKTYAIFDIAGSVGGWSVFPASTYLYSEHVAGDLADAGVNVETGIDYVGLYVSEKDAATVQLYADAAGGYMMQLRDRGSGKGWAVSRDGTVNGRVEDSFQWAFYVAGAQTVGTDKAPHFQTPAKALIEEVRVHVGTAPTGATLIVDVNDDGTTIFTTQANRPTVAISGSNATSGIPDGGTAVAKDSVLTVDVDQIGSTIAGSDLVVFVRGRLIW